MTNKEAIMVIQANALNECKDEATRQMMMDACNMAIEALEQTQWKKEEMNDIKFYIPGGLTIPTDLRLRVGNVDVKYWRTVGGFVFHVFVEDDETAMGIVEEIVEKMEFEHDESEHGVSWRTVSLKLIEQEGRYKVGTLIEWKYRVRDAF